jgi:hypothetical protein
MNGEPRTGTAVIVSHLCDHVLSYRGVKIASPLRFSMVLDRSRCHAPLVLGGSTSCEPRRIPGASRSHPSYTSGKRSCKRCEAVALGRA